MMSASGNGLMPICSPSGATSRTSRARILSLIRGSLLAGGAAMADHCSMRNSLIVGTGEMLARRRLKTQEAGVEKPTPAHRPGNRPATINRPDARTPTGLRRQIVVGWGPRTPLSVFS